jgi:2-oxoglutarate dehydrogenase E1 component
MAARTARRLPAAVVRVEELNPWPAREMADALARYERAREVVWLQEEPENMGAWPFAHERLHRELRGDFSLRHVSRPPSASPATGSQTVHEHEQRELVERLFEGM